MGIVRVGAARLAFSMAFDTAPATYARGGVRAGACMAGNLRERIPAFASLQLPFLSNVPP